MVLGLYSFSREQAPIQYATRLADEGFAALAFDPRIVGESGGMPRRLENPKMKNEDVVVSLDYLLARRHFESIPTSDKKLIWENATHHFQYYDQPNVVDRTVGHAVIWSNDHSV